MKMTLKPRFGFWDITVFPIGGSFGRAGAEGLALHDVETFPRSSATKGCNAKGKTDSGRVVAFDTAHTLEGDTDEVQS